MGYRFVYGGSPLDLTRSRYSDARCFQGWWPDTEVSQRVLNDGEIGDDEAVIGFHSGGRSEDPRRAKAPNDEELIPVNPPLKDFHLFSLSVELSFTTTDPAEALRRKLRNAARRRGTRAHNDDFEGEVRSGVRVRVAEDQR
jgi:hypothetical protein